MKKILNIILIVLFAIQLSACNNWLDILPENEQASDEYWKSKEELESTTASGYIYLRNCVNNLILWGELRAGGIYSRESNKIQTFQVQPQDNNLCNWGDLYKVINIANSVIDNADRVMANDETLTEGAKNSYLAEAYFLRALSYFYIYLNWEEAPLITTAYESDKISFKQAAARRHDIKTQIIEDIKIALETGAAKEKYDGQPWQSKGRATKWALLALLADISLWDEDYQATIDACNNIIDATAGFRPVFVEDASRWVEIFNPGNSTGSIFEINYNSSQLNSFFTLFGIGGTYQYTKQMSSDLKEETFNAGGPASSVRAMYGAWMTSLDESNYYSAEQGYIWKYVMNDERSGKTIRQYSDCNYIIYRMADVMLMKAEALIMQGGQENYQQAIDLINKIRKRANLNEIELSAETEGDMLTYVLRERNMELSGEGKRWYDLLRMGTRNNNQYRDKFLVNMVLNYNSTANPSWIRTVLNNDHAIFLPIAKSEIEANHLLKQNPYYNVTN